MQVTYDQEVNITSSNHLMMNCMSNALIASLYVSFKRYYRYESAGESFASPNIIIMCMLYRSSLDKWLLKSFNEYTYIHNHRGKNIHRIRSIKTERHLMRISLEEVLRLM